MDHDKPVVTIPFWHLVNMVVAGLIAWYGIFRFVRWWISPW